VAQWFDFDFSPVVDQTVKNVQFTWKLGDPIDAHLTTPDPMWMVKRDRFDHFLVQHAQNQGAELRENTAVTGIEFKGDRWQVNIANGSVEGRYLIAADGADGPMSQWLGFKASKRRSGFTLEGNDPKGNHTARFEFGMVKNGFIWSFPKADGCSISAATFRGGNSADVQKLLLEYASKTGIQVIQPPKEYSVCVWDGEQPLHTQHALLAGEAACVVDPITGEGIRPSIYTGVKAAEAIEQALAGNANALADYTKTVNREIGADMVWAQRIAGLFYQFPGLGYKLLKRPTAAERIGQFLCGQIRYSDVAGRIMKRLSGGLIPGMG
jgi:flavin-dependent dehydrogenase